MPLIPPILDTFGLTVAKITPFPSWRWAQFITSVFVHLDWIHLLINVWIFLMFATSLEDLLRGPRFALFILLSIAASTLGTFVFGANTPMAQHPVIGFSGVAFAVMGAFIVCYPRARVRLLLVNDFEFWLATIFLMLVSALSSLFIGSLSILAGLGLFIGLFVYWQPTHREVCVPVVAFLAYRIAVDLASFRIRNTSAASVVEYSVISAWGDAIGLIFGLVAGLLITRGKNLLLAEATSAPTTAESKPAATTAKSSTKRSAAKPSIQIDHELARAALTKLVLSNDVRGALQLYRDQIVPNVPDLVLEISQQLALARMLDNQGEQKLALHAYETLIKAYGDDPLAQPAYLAAGNLCCFFPEKIHDGIRYLEKMEKSATYNRDKLEAMRMRSELAALSSAGLEPESAAELAEPVLEVVEHEGEGNLDWKDRLKTVSQEKSAASRIRHLEPIRLPAAPENPPVPPSQPSAPISLESLWPQARSAPKPEPSEASGRPSEQEGQDGLTRLPTYEREDTSPSAASDGEGLPAQGFYDTPPISATREELPVRQTEQAYGDRQATESSDTNQSSQESLLVLAAANTPQQHSQLQQILKSSSNAHLVPGGAIISMLGQDNAVALATRIREAGLDSRVFQDSQLSAGEPIEVTGLEHSADSIAFASAGEGVQRYAPSSIAALLISRMKISPKSRSHRLCVDVFTSTVTHRFQLWERTFRPGSVGEGMTSDQSLYEAFKALAAAVPGDSLAPEATLALADEKQIPAFDSYSDYENYVAFCVLPRLGSPLD